MDDTMKILVSLLIGTIGAAIVAFVYYISVCVYFDWVIPIVGWFRSRKQKRFKKECDEMFKNGKYKNY